MEWVKQELQMKRQEKKALSSADSMIAAFGNAAMLQHTSGMGIMNDFSRTQGNRSKTIQLKPKILYGVNERRDKYRDEHQDTAYMTIDDMNYDIGLSYDEMLNKPLGVRRCYINNTIVGGKDENTINEKEKIENQWNNYLFTKRDLLKLRHLDAKQCLNDIGYKTSVRDDDIPGEKYFNGNQWSEEESADSVELNYLGNFKSDDKQRRDTIKSDNVSGNIAQWHKDYVEKEDNTAYDAGRELNRASGNQKLYQATKAWHEGPVITMLFRIISLLGLDFFHEKAYDVDFIVSSNMDTYSDNGGEPITKSELAYKRKKGFDNVNEIMVADEYGFDS